LSPRSISIWRPQTLDGETVFVRPMPGPFGDHYAERLEIPARKPAGTLRVAFFGESAAAGYLYAPDVTPAGVLAACLRSALRGPVEVIDLARTNERLRSLVVTIERSLQLAPDVLVVFAGNNWTLLESPQVSPYAPGAEARRAYGVTLSADGLWGPIQAAARSVLERAGASLARIARLAQTAEVPVVLVVPEVNLADWASRQCVPWLPGDGVARWYAAFERARRALERRDAERALEHAHAMQTLDDGVCPTAFRILAEAHHLSGDEQAAAAACRDEIAACHYATLGFLAAPQASPMVQALLRRAAQAHRFGLVDLPAIFARHTGSPCIGSRLFLDYCHLSTEGMAVAMAAVARGVEERLPLAGTSPRQRRRSLAPPACAPDVEATARLGAAAHCAHRLVSIGSRQGLLRRLCRQALAASPRVVEAMVAVVEARTGGLPAVFSEGQARLDASGLGFSLQHGWRYDHLDSDLIEAILAVLEEAQPEQDGLERAAWGRARDAIEQALDRCAVENTGAIDLIARGFFLDQPLEQLFPAIMPGSGAARRAFFRAAWPITTLAFVSNAAVALKLTLVARLPRQNGLAIAREPALARMRLQDHDLGTLSLSEHWRRSELRVPASALRRGINRLSIHWPQPAERGEEVLRAAAERLERGIESDVHPLFGELFSVRCSLA